MTPYRAEKAVATHQLSSRCGIIVHSHLRWDFVWQRPQQIFSRLAEKNPVLFVEEPCFADDRIKPTLHFSLTSGVLRAVPTLPRNLEGNYDGSISVIRGLLEQALRQPPLARHFDEVIQWFYTPMPADEMLGAFGEAAVVYDCMDELSQFRFAPQDLGRRERLLLSRADVVFTGGRKLYALKSRSHSNVHFFGCGADAEHFGRARSVETLIPSDIANLPRPILGYFGVIDERLDYELVRALAAAFRDATVLMIGPTAKVDVASLPAMPNVHWLGQRLYCDLPAYVKGFDVCLMPFALNEATEYINPTKTLEYMATGKPIVSTAVPDVVQNFAPIVAVARSAGDFIEAVRGSLMQLNEERSNAGIAMAAAHSWENVVTSMSTLAAKAVAQRRQSMACVTSAMPATISERSHRVRQQTFTYADPIAEAS